MVNGGSAFDELAGRSAIMAQDGLGEPDMESEMRIFVALYDYDPATMSPNPDALQEELPFREGQLIKVFGDCDEDGFYMGECNGLRGLVPSNMVSEVEAQATGKSLGSTAYTATRTCSTTLGTTAVASTISGSTQLNQSEPVHWLPQGAWYDSDLCRAQIPAPVAFPPGQVWRPRNIVGQGGMTELAPANGAHQTSNEMNTGAGLGAVLSNKVRMQQMFPSGMPQQHHHWQYQLSGQHLPVHPGQEQTQQQQQQMQHHQQQMQQQQQQHQQQMQQQQQQHQQQMQQQQQQQILQRPGAVYSEFDSRAMFPPTGPGCGPQQSIPRYRLAPASQFTQASVPPFQPIGYHAAIGPRMMQPGGLSQQKDQVLEAPGPLGGRTPGGFGAPTGPNFMGAYTEPPNCGLQSYSSQPVGGQQRPLLQAQQQIQKPAFMAPSGPGVRMAYPGGPVTSGQPLRPDVPHAASLATDILPNGYQQQLVNQQMSQIKQDQHFHHHQQIQQNQQQHQPQKSFQQSQQAQMTGASGSALDRRNQVRRMIALHDYDPHVLSPNVDVEAELAFRAGDVILVHGEMDEDGFYTGETVTGQRGLVPSNFLQELPKQQSREQTYPQHCLQQQPEPQLQQIRPLLQQPDTQARGSIVAATRDIRNRPVGPRGPPATGYQSTGKSVRPVAPQIVGARPQARTGQSGGPRGMTQTDGGANAGTAHSQGARGSRTRPSVT